MGRLVIVVNLYVFVGKVVGAVFIVRIPDSCFDRKALRHLKTRSVKHVPKIHFKYDG